MDFYDFHEFGVNGGLGNSRRNSQDRNSFEDERLQFLSREEKECLLFFEETIDALDDDTEDPGLGLSSGSSTSVDGRSDTPSPVTLTATKRSPSPKEHDIIDLVQNQRVLTEPRDISFNPPMPDYRTMAVNPETHFEMKAKREPMENFPSEYHLPPPPPTSEPNEEIFSHSLYQPAGSIPTPVLIAQKIAEHQGGGANLSGQRKSSDSQSPLPDSPIRHGPPTFAKPTRYPDKISFILGNREYNQTIAKAAVNVNERRAKVLANLTGGPLALDPEDQSGRNIPNRSFSFQDPSPDKSRMEALSKLGLSHKHSLPGSHPRVISPISQFTTKPETSSSNVGNYDSRPKAANPSLASTTTSTSIDLNSYGGKSKVVSPSSLLPSKMDGSSHSVVTNKTKPHLVLQHSLDSAAPVDYNSYGGKTIIMHPSVGSVPNRDCTSQHPGSYESGPSAVGSSPRATAAWTEASHCDFNNCGGKSKVMTPAHVSMAKTETSSESFVEHNSKPRLPAASYLALYKTEALPSDSGSAVNLNSYGGKSKAVTSSHLSSHKPEVTASNLRPAAALPSVTPRPHSYRMEPRTSEAPRPTQSARGGSLPAEARRRPVSKPSLFPQGITVQFSGRGATDESRREALRKLGLLKNTP